MSTYQYTKCACFWEYLVPFTRFWGVFTSVILCGVGVDVAFHHHAVGIYVIIGAVVVFFCEVTWAVTLFLQVCLRNEYSPVYRCWDVVLWLDCWKKTLLYVALSVLLFIHPHQLWLSSVAGVMLVLLASLYLLLTCKNRFETKDLLLQSREDSYDRFEDMPEVIDDSLPGPIHDSLSDSLVDQDVILEM
ncbi:transmembrane protein 72 isoform X2 [Zootermopsis nevadensis]|uniref:transmembrane protein 72 isoform X2 n=1 Tax=Zootermopsis nevadensis TaxID=136037 RepID=UPI000B8EE1B1|nr:transmembrane protein 72 isoform X2 [Zootermopsis nevadensis]